MKKDLVSRKAVIRYLEQLLKLQYSYRQGYPKSELLRGLESLQKRNRRNFIKRQIKYIEKM